MLTTPKRRSRQALAKKGLQENKITGSVNTQAAQRNDPNYLGSYAGAMAQSPSDAGAKDMPQGDLNTARAFGQRVAQVSGRLN
jgi:hypothetical protein